MVRLAIGFFRAFLAAASALSLPGMLMWLGIQKRIIFLPDVLRASCLHLEPTARRVVVWINLHRLPIGKVSKSVRSR